MSGPPRRIRLDLATPAEAAIRDALARIEAMAADVRLSEASTLLQSALFKLADYVDEQIDHAERTRP